MIPNLEKLRNHPERFKELIPEIFKELDPDKKLQTHLLWLMAMPQDLALFHAFDVVQMSLKSIEQDLEILGQLAKTASHGTIFEVMESGINYQLMGFTATGIAAREFNSELVVELPKDTLVNRIF